MIRALGVGTTLLSLACSSDVAIFEAVGGGGGNGGSGSTTTTAGGSGGVFVVKFDP